jgi:hypothetical protein
MTPLEIRRELARTPQTPRSGESSHPSAPVAPIPASPTAPELVALARELGADRRRALRGHDHDRQLDLRHDHR